MDWWIGESPVADWFNRGSSERRGSEPMHQISAQHQSPVRRLIYLMAAPLIPVLLLARMTRTVIRKRCRVAAFVRSLPLTVPAVTVLVAGEWVGCLLGPGNALKEVESTG